MEHSLSLDSARSGRPFQEASSLVPTSAPSHSTTNARAKGNVSGAGGRRKSLPWTYHERIPAPGRHRGTPGLVAWSGISSVPASTLSLSIKPRSIGCACSKRDIGRGSACSRIVSRARGMTLSAGAVNPFLGWGDRATLTDEAPQLRVEAAASTHPFQFSGARHTRCQGLFRAWNSEPVEWSRGAIPVIAAGTHANPATTELSATQPQCERSSGMSDVRAHRPRESGLGQIGTRSHTDLGAGAADCEQPEKVTGTRSGGSQQTMAKQRPALPVGQAASTLPFQARRK